jgi:predicted CopG family antitoxin
MTKKNLKLIAIDELQYSRLKELGKTAESFNDVIRTLLDKIEDKKAMGKPQELLA